MPEYFHLQNMNYSQYLHITLSKNAENVSVLAHLSNARLEYKLIMLKKQAATAYRFNQQDALEILALWEEQILQAKVLKQQLDIPDNETSDVDMELPELAAFEMIEKRQEMLRSKLLKNENVQL